MRRILVLGCPGSGKADLARKISAIMGYDVLHLQNHSMEKYSEERKQAWTETIQNIISKEKWVLEGMQIINGNLRNFRADTVVFLNIGTCCCLYRYICRFFKEDRSPLTFRTLMEILFCKRKIKSCIENLIRESHGSLMVYRINSSEEEEEFLDNLLHHF